MSAHCQFFPCFHAVWCSGLMSCEVSKELACFQSVSPELGKWIFFLKKSLQQKQKRLLFLSEYTNQLPGIFSPLTKIFLKYWWWQLLPSLSFLGKTQLGGTSLGPLQTSCVLILAVRTEGQSAGSVDSGSSSAAGSVDSDSSSAAEFGGMQLQAFLKESTWALVYACYSQHL